MDDTQGAALADPPLDLRLTEEQRISREGMRRFVARDLAPLARSADEAGTAQAAVLDAVAGFGLPLMSMPEALGGAGLPRSPLGNVLACEDLGQGDMSQALAALQPLGLVNALIDFASDAQQEAWLPRFASETLVPAAVALGEPRATFDPGAPATTARRQGEDYLLNGEKSLIPLVERCELFLVIAVAEDGPAAFLVEADRAGMSRQRRDYMGLRAAEPGSLILEDVTVPAGHRLEHFDLTRLVALARLGQAALAVGCCQAVLEQCVPYALERKAFGEPIAQRQSVAFMIANMGIEIEGMRLLVWRAASRAEQGLSFHRQAYLAALQATEKAMEIGTNGVQVFGGAGFVRDYPLEMYYRNLRGLSALHGAVMV
ncbi:acyl-CoA dehydrogenase family protein [Alloalcanivorax mobilis]|uniref:acyl-CoA dehydrogenase family protein n=1 Tax=Alloalcanivorax mobilis TaxID=2019569 RepID=UPI001E4222C5|nr:acyl-CoA dehydrogenase family protein [Alloalcanivorax mobilis]